MEEQHTRKDGLRTYEGAVAIITGGASGIGKALAEELADKGAQAVVLVDRQSAENVAETIRSSTIEAKAYEVDVRNFDDIKKVVTETVEAYGRLDYMFNNAGTTVAAPLEKLSVQDFNYVLDVNIGGVVHGVEAAYPVMKEQGFGHIVNTSSIGGLMPSGQGFVAYGTSTHAIVGLSTNLRVEAARHGVDVSVLCPGVVDTPLLKGCGKFGKNLSGVPQEEIDKFEAKANLMEPREFAKRALKLVAKNKPIIIVPSQPWKLLWFVHRMSPSLGLYLARKRNDKNWRKWEKEYANNE